MKKFFSALCINLIFLGLIFCVVELWLRHQADSNQSSVSAVGIPIYQNDPLTGYWHKPHANAENGYGDPTPYIYTNRLGLRDPGKKFDFDTPSVLLLGDSFTFGTGLNYKDTFAGILDEQFLVDNAGIVGHTMDQYLVRLKKLTPELKPDFVIVNTFVANDITEFRRHEWETKDGKITAVKDLKVFATEEGKLRSREQIPPKSYAWNFLSTRWNVFQSKYLSTLFPIPHTPTLTWPVFLPSDHPHQDPKLEEYWEEFFTALDQIQEYCTENDIQLLVSLIPMDTQVSKHYWNKYAIRHFDDEAFTADRPQKRILAHCETKELQCIDLLPHLRNHPDKDILYFQNEDPHFDVAGHRATAEILVDWIETNQ